MGGADTGDTCLSDAQLAVVKAWTTDAIFEGSAPIAVKDTTLRGTRMIHSTLESGFPAMEMSIRPVSTCFKTPPSSTCLARDPKADSLTYSPWDRNQSALYALAALNDATQTDIRPFIKAGGKLIVWHGGSDAALSVNSTIEYMTNMEKSVGAENAAAATRFYVAPGVDHCEGGAGADKTDLLTALDQWVTKGVAPATLTAQKLDAKGAVIHTLPLCQYPQYPRYIGPANDAAAATAGVKLHLHVALIETKFRGIGRRGRRKRPVCSRQQLLCRERSGRLASSASTLWICEQ